MSKSLGNVIIPHELLERVPGEVVRWALLSAHYRQPLDWTERLLEQSRSSLDRLYGVLRRARDIEQVEVVSKASLAEALSDDLNTPFAQSVLFNHANALEKALLENSAAAGGHKYNLLFTAGLMGFLQQDPEAWFQGGADEDLKAKVEALLEERIAARTAKDWPTADRIRAELDALGVVVMDGPSGATWRMRD